MKITTLNTWGGRAGKEKLLEFFKDNKDVDVFCLQEVWKAPYEKHEGMSAGGIPVNNAQILTEGVQKISEALLDHQGYFRPHHLDNYGLFMLIRKKLKVEDEGELFVYREKGYIPTGDIGTHARNIQYVTIIVDEKPITVINFHGLWTGTGKKDTEDRIKQSEKIVAFIKMLKNDCILCGDFNLLPDTKSIRLFEEAGLRNLVSEYKITSTRTSLYTKSTDKFADYIFVSKGIDVLDFKVLPEEVSDHNALLIEIA